MLRAFALATLLLLALLWATVPFVATGNSPTPRQAADLPNAQSNLISLVTTGAVITVTTTTDEVVTDGNCSLREAIQAAALDAVVDACPAGSGGDMIYIPAGHYQLTLGQLHLTGTVTLQGSVTSTTLLDANNQSRVFYIERDANVALRHLDIRNGDLLYCPTCYPRDGGGLINFGTTWIDHTVIHGNRARISVYGPYGSDGGGISNRGILTITNSTISGNRAGDSLCSWHSTVLECGRPGKGGGIFNLGMLTLDNTTITRNKPGSAFFQEPPDLLVTVGSVGGIYNDDRGIPPGGSPMIHIKNSILAGNEGSDCVGQVTSLGHNIIEKIDDCSVSGDFIHWVAYLGPLSDNGGPTLTHLLGRNSPALDAGNCTDSAGRVVSVDQRGEPRPQGSGCDIGAYESPYTSTLVLHRVGLPLIGYSPASCTGFVPACNLTKKADMHDSAPSWSPDGNRIAFARSRSEESVVGTDAGIYVMNADGSAMTRLSDHGDEPVWSPRGDKIAFSSTRDGGHDIYVMDSDGTNQINLTGSTAQLEKKAIWSPDGNKILYDSHSEADLYPDIYVMNADGSQKIRLAAAARFSNAPWSPDSSKIVFESSESIIIDADGNNRVAISTGDFSHWRLAWSPDGSHFASQCIAQNLPTFWTICTLKIDGSETTRFPHDYDYDHSPIWSPDGSKLLFYYDISTLDEQGANEILVMNADGTNRKMLATVPIDTYIGYATWSPDSRRIAYTSGVTGDREIYVVGVD